MTRGVFVLYRRKKRRIHKRLRRLLVFSVILLVCAVILFEAQAVPFTAKCVKKQSKTISTRIINQCVEKILSDSPPEYNDFADVKYSDSGCVQSISANTKNINKLKAKITLAIQKELDKGKSYSFSLPLGAFTDLTLLSTLGPLVEINFILTGSVNCKLKSAFESGGVNQTVHHIILTVDTEIITISPEYREQTRFSTDFEIAQTVIVGSVPSTFADIVR